MICPSCMLQICLLFQSCWYLHIFYVSMFLKPSVETDFLPPWVSDSFPVFVLPWVFLSVCEESSLAFWIWRSRLIKHLVSVCKMNGILSFTESSFSDPAMCNVAIALLMHEDINFADGLIRHWRVQTLCPRCCLVCHGWRASLTSIGAKFYRRWIWSSNEIFTVQQSVNLIAPKAKELSREAVSGKK